MMVALNSVRAVPGKLRLVESMRAIGYAPMYYLLEKKFLEEEGLVVEVISAGSPVRASEIILADEGDVAWGGPVRVLMNHDRDPGCPLVCFGNVIARDPFILVGREPNPHFRFADLNGLSVAVATDVTTAWLTFQDDLARAGIDPRSLHQSSAPSMQENVARFARGEVDVIQVFEPHLQKLLATTEAHVWHRFSQRGDICYTSLYAKRAFTESRGEACAALLRGLQRAKNAFRNASPSDVAQAVAHYFPDESVKLLADAIAGYKAAGLWSDSTDLPLAAFLKLKALAVSSGFIATDVGYSKMVQTEFHTRSR